MFKYLITLAIASATSVSAVAQPAPANQAAPAAGQAQPAQPQMVKKLVCVDNDDPFTNIHRTCRTVMVPAKPAAPSRDAGQAQPQTQPQSGNR